MGPRLQEAGREERLRELLFVVVGWALVSPGAFLPLLAGVGPLLLRRAIR